MGNLRFGLALALGTVLAGLTGCDQGTQSETREIPVETGEEAAGSGARAIGEGRKLEGEALDAFLEKIRNSGNPGFDAQGNPLQQAQPPAMLSKQAAQNCLIDFNDYNALSQLPQKASSWYTTFPWYRQPCGSHIANIMPEGKNYYYLTTEAAGTCSGNPGYIGYGPVVGPQCKNQMDAALFPRVAGNGSPTDKALGLVVMAESGGYYRNFDINNLKVLVGPVVVYGWRNGQGWWWWGPLGAGDWYWTNGQNVAQMRIHSWNLAGIYVVDNIRINAY